MSRLQNLLNYTPLYKSLFFICIVITEFLATTSNAMAAVVNIWDKANHFIAFAILYVLFSLGWRSGYFVKFYIKFYVLIAFGFQIELVQMFLPNCYFSLLDVVADMLGIFVGMGITKILDRFLSHNQIKLA